MSGLARDNGYRLARLGPVSHRLHVRRTIICALLCLLVLAGALAAAPLGSYQTGFGDLLDVLLRPDRATGQGHAIILDFRLPRILLALLCGAMLGLAGAAMQSVTRNGLADPGLLGVREGASLAVISLVIALPTAPLFLRPLVGMTGGLAVALLVAMIAGNVSRLRFILIGIGVSWALSAALSVILTTAEIRDVQTALIWMAGSLNAASWEELPLALACCTIGATLLLITTRAADTALLGDAAAIGLGVRLRRLAVIRFAAAALLTAACVSTAGSLGFVGLIAPHLARLAIGGGQLALLTGSGVIAAALVLAADTIGRLAFAPLQLPAGIVLSIVGVPVLLALLWQRRNQL